MVTEQSTSDWITAEYNDQLQIVVPVKDKKTILVKQSGNVFLVNILPSHHYLIAYYTDIFVEVICAFILHASQTKRQTVYKLQLASSENHYAQSRYLIHMQHIH